MNVLHLISGGEVGGSKNHLISILKNMDKAKHNNIVVCFIEGKLYNECLEAGIDIRLVKQNKRFDMSVVSRIKEICQSENIDIINCHGGRANFVGYFLKKKYSGKYVTTIHSDYKGDYRGNAYKTLVYSNINKFVLKSFNYYITVSRDFKNMLITRGFNEKNIFVVYNGIDFNFERTIKSNESIISEYGLNSASHYVSMVARFHPIKGHRYFVDACKKVIEDFKDVDFILVGDGETLNEVKNYTIKLGMEKYFDFVGFRKPDDFLKLSDFTVLTSYSESFPLALLESTAYSKTIIATEVGGIPDLIDDGINGYLIKPGDTAGLADRMVELLQDSEKAYVFGRKLYEKAFSNFSIERLVESYIHIYETILVGGKVDD